MAETDDSKAERKVSAAEVNDKGAYEDTAFGMDPEPEHAAVPVRPDRSPHGVARGRGGAVRLSLSRA